MKQTPPEKLIVGKLYRTLDRIRFYQERWKKYGGATPAKSSKIDDETMNGALLMFLGQELVSENSVVSYCFLTGQEIVYTETKIDKEKLLLTKLEGPLL